MPLAAGIEIAVIDIDKEQRFLEKFDELVPVLAGRHDHEEEKVLCHYFLDTARVEHFLSEFAR